MGVALGVVYDIFKVLRLLGLNSFLTAFFEDILFFLISTITIFSFYMQITDGKFRIYPLVSAFLGFLIYFLTLEKIVFYIIKKIYNFIVFIFSFIYRKIVLFIIKKVKQAFVFLLSPIFRVINKLLIQNIAIFFKKLLQKMQKMLYNNQRRNKKRKGKSGRGKKEQNSRQKAFFC